MERVTGESITDDIDDKKRVMLAHGIALYDVIESCDIIGSSDSSIKNVEPADIKEIIKSSDIGAVFTNGGLAKKLYDRYELPVTAITATGLPSTSPANAAYSLERLMEYWIEIKSLII
jgi:hypoxanthine-DNA glycosylase